MSLLLMFIVLIQSCSTTNTGPQETQATSSGAQQLEDSANASSGTERAVYQLSAAEAWHLELNTERASITLANIDTTLLPADELIKYSLLYAEIMQLQGRHQDALEILAEPLEQNRLFEAQPIRQAEWGERTGNINLAIGQYEQAVRYFDHALSKGNKTDILERVRTSLWKSLTLSANLPEAPFYSSEMPGWISLAEISNVNAGSLGDQLQQFQNWRQANFGHPADRQPPESIQALESLANEPPPRVALLLPMTGNLAPAGNAVLDGYMATVDINRGSDSLNPSEVLIFDTNSQDMNTILQELYSKQVNVVIGPLDKGKVHEFATLADPALRALTLNSIESNAGSNKSILGLALDIEDEASQAATAALRDGHITALAMVPNNSSGDRASGAFAQTWEQKNGDLLGVDRYGSSDTHADLLESRLHIDQSMDRMREIRTLLAKNLEFTPRRRQDIDALFLSASPEQARQIKPMLAFFFADDIPVYSTSSVYDGTEDPKANQDLDGIRFSTLPWIISDSNIQEELRQSAPATGGLLKLQAMGVDAYYLSQRIPQFMDAEISVYHGVLGKLSLPLGARNLDRQQVWAKFSQGAVSPIP